MSVRFNGCLFTCSVLFAMLLRPAALGVTGAAPADAEFDPKPLSELLSLMYMNKATMLGGPEHDYTTDTALQCARDCLADSFCVAFGLYGDDVSPGAVNCRRYEELSFVVYHATSVIYHAGKPTTPLP